MKPYTNFYSAIFLTETNLIWLASQWQRGTGKVFDQSGKMVRLALNYNFPNRPNIVSFSILLYYDEFIKGKIHLN